MREFQNAKELQEFVRPALKLRTSSLKEEGIEMSNEELFQYLKEKKWKAEENLHLYEIADDILNFPIEKRNQGDRRETI